MRSARWLIATSLIAVVGCAQDVPPEGETLADTQPSWPSTTYQAQHRHRRELQSRPRAGLRCRQSRHWRPVTGHDGENKGFVSIMQGLTGAGLGAVVMTNGDNGTAVAKKVIQIIATDQGWPGYR